MKDKVVLVLGGSSGMGRATAKALGDTGAHVIVAARRLSLCQEVAEEICRAGGQARSAQVDVTDSNNVTDFFAELELRHGQLDGVFNNFGRTLGNSLTHETPPTRFQQTLEINLISVFRCMQHELRIMRNQSGGGVIINNSSIGGTRGFSGLQDYCAAKWGLIGLSKAAALENATHHIRINVIAPGLIASERFEEVRAQRRELIEARISEVPMQRPGHMDDVAQTVAWLLSPACSYLTGAVIPIDGGECAQ